MVPSSSAIVKGAPCPHEGCPVLSGHGPVKGHVPRAPDLHCEARRVSFCPVPTASGSFLQQAICAGMSHQQSRRSRGGQHSWASCLSAFQLTLKSSQSGSAGLAWLYRHRYGTPAKRSAVLQRCNKRRRSAMTSALP